MKKNTLIISAILVMAGLLVWSTGCKKDDGPSPDYVIQVDSVVMPDTIQLTDTLSVKFYGEVGPNGCYKFERFENISTGGSDPANSMKFRLWGKHEDTGNCSPQPVNLDGIGIGINGFIEGNFSVLVIQPNETIMVSTVYVKE